MVYALDRLSVHHRAMSDHLIYLFICVCVLYLYVNQVYCQHVFIHNIGNRSESSYKLLSVLSWITDLNDVICIIQVKSFKSLLPVVVTPGVHSEGAAAAGDEAEAAFTSVPVAVGGEVIQLLI